MRDTPCKDAAGYPVPGGRAPIVRVWVNPASGCGSTLRQGEGHSVSDGRTSCVRMKDTLRQDEELPESG